MKSIEIFIYEQAIGLDVMGPLEVFSAANYIRNLQGKPPAYEVVLSAQESGLVTLSSGVAVQATRTLGDDYSFGNKLSDKGSHKSTEKGTEKGNERYSDYFILTGGFVAPQLAEDTDLVARLTQRAKASKYQVSICTGTFLLAATGLLDGKNCTTHWHYADQLAARYPELNVNGDAIYIQDDTTYSSAGVTAGIDLALALLEQDYGAELAMEVARSLVLYRHRPGCQSQFSTPLSLRQKAGKSFYKLHDWLQSNIQLPVSVEQMADFCRMSPRNFARRFTEITQITPAKYLEQLRLSQARELLESTPLTIESIALDTGFGREERLRRTFLKTLGVTPSLYRQHFASENSP